MPDADEIMYLGVPPSAAANLRVLDVVVVKYNLKKLVALSSLRTIYCTRTLEREEREATSNVDCSYTYRTLGFCFVLTLTSVLRFATSWTHVYQYQVVPFPRKDTKEGGINAVRSAVTVMARVFCGRFVQKLTTNLRMSAKPSRKSSSTTPSSQATLKRGIAS